MLRIGALGVAFAERRVGVPRCLLVLLRTHSWIPVVVLVMDRQDITASARDGNRAAGRPAEVVAHRLPPGRTAAGQLGVRVSYDVARMRSGLISVVYFIVGVVVAVSDHYFTHISTLKPLLSALLAVVLWPLLLLGVNLHIK